MFFKGKSSKDDYSVFTENTSKKPKKKFKLPFLNRFKFLYKNKIVSFFQSLFSSKDLSTKIFVTLLIVLIYRALAAVPLPGVDMQVYGQTFGQASASETSYLFTLFTGGRLDSPSIVGLGLAAYINASIIMQLLPYAIPKLKEIQKQGERGKQIINQLTRFLTLPLSFFYSIAYLMLLSQRDFNSVDGVTPSGNPLYLIPHAVGANFPSIEKIIFMAVALTAGTIFLMWLSEFITEKGIGNGSSVIITVGIIASLPSLISADLSSINFQDIITNLLQGSTIILTNPRTLSLIGVFVGLILLVVAIIFVNESLRKIPVQYARRVRGTETGKGSFLPIKFTMTGVLPVIFTYAFLSVPQLLVPLFKSRIDETSGLFDFLNSIENSFLFATQDQIVDSRDTIYAIVYFILVLVFGVFYAFIVMNPKETAENLQKSGAFIPGIRPGKSTEKYITGVLLRIGFVGAVLLALIALSPIIASDVVLSATGSNLVILSQIGGTSLLILVSVYLDIFRQYKSLVATRSYERYIR